ncbi:ABC transporter ATP-binding protein [Thermodesulforhabdus norvegica]|uniref:Amino acid/amide ABC transporter ATP-binding protein 2, HAAT family n=1 Tax=Thermodesulforhabdus norvegica TaxID=39841 RepID=A0A1I4ULH3_9BACT|nr:ABC transporter ATP-binding protein [Thermodesulforhabdus norvegica]SFM89816.1 amino acid/amide ABC transporter ATP-binding protein 2, HAAT family [Thermodesulforhabdus norvegica]
MSLLRVEDIKVDYGDIRALWGVSLRVEQGRTVALIGANGAGKTTTLKSICGLLPVSEGRIFYQNQDISGLPVYKVVDLGITLIPEGRQLFPKMTVEENLLVGSYIKRARDKRAKSLARVYELFPRLAERRKQVAETLSGGEQQMLAIGRGLMQDPDLIMFDEPSLGLAPVVVHEVFRTIRELRQMGLTVLIVEQNVHQVLKVADYCYVIERGRVVKEGPGADLEKDPAVREAYLGF